MKYRKKNSIVEAVEITTNVFAPDFVPTGLFEAKEIFKRQNKRLYIRDRSGMVETITIGDFLVQFSDGTFGGSIRDAFLAEFEPLDIQ